LADFLKPGLVSDGCANQNKGEADPEDISGAHTLV
jgi:hypothetical protein